MQKPAVLASLSFTEVQFLRPLRNPFSLLGMSLLTHPWHRSKKLCKALYQSLVELLLFFEENLVIGKEEGMNIGVHELLVAEDIHEPEPILFRLNPVDCFHHKFFVTITNHVHICFTHL
jgi:hypothetical protein